MKLMKYTKLKNKLLTFNNFDNFFNFFIHYFRGIHFGLHHHGETKS
jgi:hypothetical protein